MRFIKLCICLDIDRGKVVDDSNREKKFFYFLRKVIIYIYYFFIVIINNEKYRVCVSFYSVINFYIYILMMIVFKLNVLFFDVFFRYDGIYE